MQILERLKTWARAIKSDVAALAVAARHPATPWYAKALAVAIVAYALSSIDLIPDFIPILGLLDELIILPAAILLTLRLIPATLLAECRVEAARRSALPTSRTGAAIIVTLWAVAFGATIWWLARAS